MDRRIIDFFSQRLDGASRSELLREVATDEVLRSAFIRYRNLTGMAALAGQPGDDAAGRAHYVRFMAGKARRSQRVRIFRMVRYAAAVALLAIGGWSVFHWYGAGADDHSSMAQHTLHVPAGQRASLTLSDGTVVWLNANSTLIYPAWFGDGERKVTVSGEAFFTVAKDQDHPFVVTTSTVAIKVLGTVFNVSDNNGSGATQVSLLEGRIEVGMPDSRENILMVPDQLLTYRDGRATVTHGVDEQEFLWRDGIIQFRELPLSVIAERLSQYYGVRIAIGSDAVAARTYTGKFRLQDGVGEILRIIQRAQKFNLTRNETDNSFVIR